MAARDELINSARKRDDLFNVRSGGLDDVLQYDVDIDVESAMAHGLDKNVVDNAIAAYWGSAYINDFSDRGRTKRVYMQADAPLRMARGDFGQYPLRNASGEMTPISIFAKIDESKGSPRLERYQGVPAVKILGEAATGKSAAVALDLAVKQRFRPIVMTSLAFVLGVTPLALNSGAGSGAQNLVGMTVVFGVLSATVFGLYLTPLFFMWINNLIGRFGNMLSGSN